MSRLPTIAAAVAAALLAGAVPTVADEPVHVEGLADWLAGAPGKDHAARAYPQYAQQQPTTPLKLMGVTALMGRLRLGDTPLVVDVRTYREFVEAHLPNAVSIPLAEVDKRIGEFPRQGTIVLY
jgi:hypothetical protein